MSNINWLKPSPKKEGRFVDSDLLKLEAYKAALNHLTIRFPNKSPELGEVWSLAATIYVEMREICLSECPKTHQELWGTSKVKDKEIIERIRDDSVEDSEDA